MFEQQVGDRILVYRNKPDGGFANFRGQEKIYDKTSLSGDEILDSIGAPLFWHRYTGHLFGFDLWSDD